MQRPLTLVLFTAALAAMAQEPGTPTLEAQHEMLAAAGRYAEQYVSTLPNFICQQVTEQYRAGRKGNHWKKGDTLVYRLAFSKGRDRRTLEIVNNKPIQSAVKRWRTPLQTEGEFGELMEMVLSDVSSATFDWHGWTRSGTRQLASFDYAVDKAHSGLKLTHNDLASAIVPYHGTIYLDPETGAIWKVTEAASDIPPELETLDLGTTLEYSEVGIGGKPYLLPSHATVLQDTFSYRVRNELTFRDYRKFEAESSVQFGTSEASEPKQ